MSTDKEWLASLKAGDKAWLPGRWDKGQIVTISRITPTQIVVDGVGRFKRDSGRMVGQSDGWRTPWLRSVTQDVADDIERQELARWLDKRDWKTLPLAFLRSVKAAYGACIEPETKA